VLRLGPGRRVIPRLGDAPGTPFPPIESALDEPDGLLAWGGDLSPERLLEAYRQGIFPWYSGQTPILWWCPSQRCVIPTARVHVSRRLQRLLRHGKYAVTADRAFDAVVAGCAQGRGETWITPAMRRAYQEMHRLGFGHSIEVWLEDELAGGLYGLALGRMFFGESMFSRQRDASKVALVSLCRVLHRWGCPWLDCQLLNPHLERMGAVLMPRASFTQRLHRLVAAAPADQHWRHDFATTLASLADD